MDKITETELNERALAPRITLEALEANIMSEVYFTASQGARAALLDSAVEAEEQPRGEDIIRQMQSFPQSLGLLTICVVTLRNGFTVIGQSACASPENFQADIGRRIARDDAVRQVWALMGYELRSKLAYLTELRGVEDRIGDALTRLTAYGLGNKEVLRPTDIDTLFNHFMREHGDLAREAVTNGVDIASVPVAPPLSQAEPEADFAGVLDEPEFMGTNQDIPLDEHLVETNELGPRHPEQEDEPVVGSEAPQVKED